MFPKRQAKPLRIPWGPASLPIICCGVDSPFEDDGSGHGSYLPYGPSSISVPSRYPLSDFSPNTHHLA